MLEKCDLSRTTAKPEYKEIMDKLEIEVGILQRETKELGIPVIIIFEGWDAAGKGTMINRLLLAMDPRLFTVYPTNAPNEEERMRPFLWRHWMRIPERGRTAIFDRSWYGRVLVERVDGIIKKKEWSRAFPEIRSFERQMVDDGYIIIKFFLHISKKEQKKRFNQLEKDKTTRWKVTKDDWKHHKQYNKYLHAIEEMLAETDTAYAPWTVVEAHDWRFATVKIFRKVAQELTRNIQEHRGKVKVKAEGTVQRDTTPSILHKVDLGLSLDRQQYEKDLEKAQERIWELEHEIYLKRIPVIIVYQGWDAAGKGGNIKRLVQKMDPRGYEVIPIAAPNDEEKAHHYLWRFWRRMPKAGHIAVFDRSWYGRVLVERVEGFCTEEEWQRSYREINEMEQQLVDFGAVMVKFWLHIDEEEQLKRFKEREQTPHKQWKITEEDWRNREKRALYLEAVDEMLFRTSTNYAPWTIVESNSKTYARVKALKTVITEIEKAL